MTEHNHREFLPGCFRCDLSRAEAEGLKRAKCQHVQATLHKVVDGVATCDKCGEKFDSECIGSA